MPEDARPFLGEALIANGRKFLLTVSFPKPTSVGMSVEGQHKSNDGPMEFALPVGRPSILGQGNPSFGAKQECLGIGAFGVTCFDGVTRKRTHGIECLGGLN